ncbi:bifunctional DNA primase/polymerase [Streptomyces sp. NPDC004237]|uniref:bifunctional DNA primase/polymerase n=1 Tax=Streptomyces sp. NPDC004237 TaxID=3154455 RepID=UPI0033A31215
MKLGFGVFPMPDGLKRPVVEDWPKLACTSVDEIEIYWHSFCRPGWTNLALTLPNHVVVDVDLKNNGWTGLAKLEADHGRLPATRRHRTGLGGVHLIYAKHAGSDGLFNKPLDPWRYPGIDIKVNYNGLIVAPGSRSAAGLYVIEDDRECAPAPEFLSDTQQNARYQPPTNAPHASYGVARMTFEELAALPADDPYRSSYPWNGQEPSARGRPVAPG